MRSLAIPRIQPVKLLSALVVSILLLGGCAEQAKQAKLETVYLDALYRSGRTLDAAIATGVTYAKYGELVTDLATELLIATDHASDPEQIAILALYAGAVETYSDCATLWEAKIDNASISFLDGDILLDGPIISIANKYKLVGSENYEGHAIRGDSVQALWEVASKKAGEARARYLALGASKPKG